MRDVNVLVRLSEDEALLLDQHIRPQGLKRATFLRFAMLEKLKRDRLPEKPPSRGRSAGE